MGIDIYLGGYEGYERRTRDERKVFDAAVKLRDSLPRDSQTVEQAQLLVEAAADNMWAASKGYLRSSYNSSGLFSVLDRIFGTDTAALLFPGDWEQDVALDWDKFLEIVAQMKAIGRVLKHGDPLPVRFDELDRPLHKQRQSGEAFGRAVLGLVCSAVGDDVVRAGNDHQHGFYNDDDYGWYVREGLDDLEDFGKLGKRLAEQGQNTGVYISY